MKYYAYTHERAQAHRTVPSLHTYTRIVVKAFISLAPRAQIALHVT